MIKYTKAQILENRQIWINYLKSPEALKGTGRLERIIGNITYRCCLGHGCFILKEKLNLERTISDNKIYYDKETGVAPIKFIEAVGLRGCCGYIDKILLIDEIERDFYSLAALNDGSKLSSQEIGSMLETMINGGEGTPFKALDEYPETLEKEENE